MIQRITFGRFIEYCRYQRNLSEATCYAYTSDWRIFRDWYLARNHRLAINRISPEDIRQYVIHMRKKKNAQNTILRHTNALSSFFDYCMKWHGMKVNPVSYCERGRKQKHKVRIPSRDMVEGLLASLEISCRPTHHVAFLLATHAGLRFAEILALTWENVNLLDGTLIVYGKGRKERKVPIIEPLKDRLEVLCSLHSDEKHPATGPVIVGDYGRPASKKMLRRLWKKYCRELTEHGFTWHSLRRYFATRLYREGIGPVEIKELLGHESLETTLAYIEPDTQSLKARLKGIRI